MARCKQTARASAGPSRVPYLVGTAVTQANPPAQAPVPQTNSSKSPAPSSRADDGPKANTRLSGYLAKYDHIHQRFTADFMSREWFKMIDEEYFKVKDLETIEEELCEVVCQLDANPQLHTRTPGKVLVTKDMKYARKAKRNKLKAQYAFLSDLSESVKRGMLFPDTAQRKLFKEYRKSMEASVTLRKLLDRQMDEELRQWKQEEAEEKREKAAAMRSQKAKAGRERRH